MFYLSDAASALKNSHTSKQIPGPGKIVLALCPFIEKTSQPHPSEKGDSSHTKMAPIVFEAVFSSYESCTLG